jgi:hypothetical protein
MQNNQGKDDAAEFLCCFIFKKDKSEKPRRQSTDDLND